MHVFVGLVSISQTAMRVRGQWSVGGIDDTMRRDIRSMVNDVAKIVGADSVNIEMAIRALERRAGDRAAA